MTVRSLRYAIWVMAVVVAGWLVRDSAKAQAVDNTTLLPLVMGEYDAGWQWQTSEAMELAPKPASTPVVAIDAAGRLHVLWDTRTYPRFIYHRYFDGSGWSAPAPVAESLGTSELLYAPLVDDAGALHLVWRSDLGVSTDSRYRLLYAAFDGVRWGGAAEVYRSTNSQVPGMVQTDEEGGIRIVVVDGILSTYAYQFTPNGNGWAQSGQIRPSFSSAVSDLARYGWRDPLLWA